MKVVLIILDGLGDRPLKQLNGMTPLEAAATPNLDWLASQSACGLLWPIKGIAPESGEAQFVLLGQCLKKWPGRGPVEALGAGLRLRPDRVYFRVNFASYKGKRLVDLRIVPSKEVIQKINSLDPNFKLFPTISYRAVLEAKGISAALSNNHPGYVRLNSISKAVSRALIKRKLKGHKESAAKLNRFIEKVEQEVGLTLLLRGAGYGRLPKLAPMRNWAFIGEMPVERGLAKLLRMRLLKRQKDVIAQILKTRQNCYVQLKGPDLPAHRGDWKEKIKAIEAIDRQLVPLVRAVKACKLDRLCITADHATPCLLRRHSADPVPYLIFGKPKLDKVQSFNERACRKGFKLQGSQLMKELLS